LFSILRSAIHRLTTEDQFANFIAALDLLGGFQRRFRELRLEVQDEQNAQAMIPTIQNVEEEIDNSYEAVRVSIRHGSYNELQRQATLLLKGRGLAPTLDELTGQRLKGYAKTIAALQKFECGPWPLAEAEVVQCRQLFSDHVARLLPETITNGGNLNSETIAYAIRALRGSQTALTAEILGMLPESEGLKMAAVEERKRQIIIADRRLEALSAELRALREQALHAIEFCSSDASPSLHKIMGSIAREKRFKLGVATVKDAAIAYGTKILSPENLLKILHGGAGA
jgi:hypothetical protein